MTRRRDAVTLDDDEDLSRHYARILGQRAPDHRISEVLRACLRALPRRLAVAAGVRREVALLIERVLRVGEVGTLDIAGTPREIDAELAGALGESASDPRRIYRALRALLGRTVLVERPSRQVWVLRLSSLSDPTSALHRALIAETPSQYRLPSADQHEPASPVPRDQEELAKLRRALEDERTRRVEAEHELQAARAELVDLRRHLEDERQRRTAAEKAAEHARVECDRLTVQHAEARIDAPPDRTTDDAVQVITEQPRPAPVTTAREARARAELHRQVKVAATIATRVFGLSEENAARAVSQIDVLQARMEPPQVASEPAGQSGKGSGGRGGKNRDKRKRRRSR